MWWIILLVLHIAVIASWYWLSTLPNRGTGGLGDVVLPVILTVVVFVVDVVIAIYQIYKQMYP